MTPDGPAVFLVHGLIRRADDEVESSGIYTGMSHKGQFRFRKAVKEGSMVY